jgi:hypothetical protein
MQPARDGRKFAHQCVPSFAMALPEQQLTGFEYALKLSSACASSFASAHAPELKELLCQHNGAW